MRGRGFVEYVELEAPRPVQFPSALPPPMGGLGGIATGLRPIAIPGLCFE